MTIELSVQGDGQLWCNEEQCPDKKFGASPHTQGEFNVFKHVVAYHSPEPTELLVVQGGPTKKMKQAVLDFPTITSHEKRRRDQKAHNDRMRAQLARQRSPPTRAWRRTGTSGTPP